jgi:hypothetical protein
MLRSGSHFEKARVCSHNLGLYHIKRVHNGALASPCVYPGCSCHDFRPIIKKSNHSPR